MPVLKEREYRAITTPLTAMQNSGEKRIDSAYYVEGYATTFDKPYLLYEFEDGTKIYEKIDRNALVGADVSDVIMQYDHEGRVYARQSNGTLVIEPNEHGIFIAADLSKTAGAKELHGDIAAGMINKMSWAFTIAPNGDEYDEKTHTRTIKRIKKVYDVSAVSIPANGDTEIAARSFAQGRFAAEQQEQLKKRVALLKLKTNL